MDITVIADASYCPDTGKAGYGFWVASQRGKLGGEGAMTGIIENNIAAEMIALLNALYAAYNADIIHEGDFVLMQTDCQPAIDAFEDTRKTMTDAEVSLVNWFKYFHQHHGITFKFKHVKGHSASKEKRFVVNNICDRNARKHMRIARDKYKRESILEYLKCQK